MIQRLDTNLDERCLQELAPRRAWNRLWQRSGDSLPFSRWECLQLLNSNEVYEPSSLVCVEQKYATTIGISLVMAKRFGVRYFRNRNSEWIQAGQLLVDRSKVTSKCFDRFAKKLKALPAGFVYMDWADQCVESSRLLDALDQNGLSVFTRPQLETGLIRLNAESFDEYFATRSKGFRKKIRSSLKKLKALGNVEYRCEDVFNVSDSDSLELIDGKPLGELLERIFEVEHQGWKGKSGSSFNSNPAAKAKMIEMCEASARSGHLQIHYLVSNQNMIAFDVGFTTDEKFFSFKIGYDSEFGKFSPGQLLTYFQLKHWFFEGRIKLVDTVGELTAATAKWTNETVLRQRHLISTGSWWSNLFVKAYEKAGPLAKKLLRQH